MGFKGDFAALEFVSSTDEKLLVLVDAIRIENDVLLSVFSR